MPKLSLLALLLSLALALVAVGTFVVTPTGFKTEDVAFHTDHQSSQIMEGTPDELSDDNQVPLLDISIEYLRSIDYPGSQLEIEETLNPGSNYQRYIASYQSEGLRQFGLLTIPNGEVPQGGWPAIIFNHGYIDPDVYQTTERYIAYTDGFSRQGYVLFRPDYRGHANSEGQARGGYSNSDYIIDVLNAVSSIKTLDEVNPDQIGMWGHSMGGWITHRAMVVDDSIKAGVIWAGVVGGYDDLLDVWLPWWVRNGVPEPTLEPGEEPRRRWRDFLSENFGTPAENPEFWNSISAEAYLDDLSGPIQQHHGTADTSVPVELAQRFAAELDAVNQPNELYVYQGDDHNLSQNFATAMRRSVEFFDGVLK